jgi:hypothetical protein
MQYRGAKRADEHAANQQRFEHIPLLHVGSNSICALVGLSVQPVTAAAFAFCRKLPRRRPLKPVLKFTS